MCLNGERYQQNPQKAHAWADKRLMAHTDRDDWSTGATRGRRGVSIIFAPPRQTFATGDDVNHDVTVPPEP